MPGWPDRRAARHAQPAVSLAGQSGGVDGLCAVIGGGGLLLAANTHWADLFINGTAAAGRRV